MDILFLAGKKISPNIKKIDTEIERLRREIINTRDWDQKIEQDKLLSGGAKFAVDMLESIPLLTIFYKPIKYITDGIDNHSFDLYSPELIEQAIREGKIKPFRRVLKPKEKTPQPNK